MSKIWWKAASAAAVLATLLVGVALWQPASPTDEAVVLVGGSSSHHGDPIYFTLEATPVRALHPGAVRQMKVTLINKLGYRLKLQRLSGKVTSSSRRGCSATAANLQVKDYSGSLPVSISARARTSLGGAIPVVMPPGASQKCAGARFTITLSGIGYRADR
jgi:hypothetical protein